MLPPKQYLIRNPTYFFKYEVPTVGNAELLM